MLVALNAELGRGMAMTDWAKRQTECAKCRGGGYVYGEYCQSKSGNVGREPLWVMRCECQPQTMPDLEEAVQKEIEKTA